jgi:hypothetical protein
VLFGQQLADVMVQRALLAVWPTHVGEISTIMITTTSVDRVFLPGVRVRLVPLAAAFRVRGDGLVADEAVWAGVQAVPATTNQARHGPFANDFSTVLLPGEADPIALTPAQASLMRVLWEQQGAPMRCAILLAQANVGMEKPVQAFQRQKYPDANRAYHALVRADRQGRYCIPVSSKSAADAD